MIDGGAVFPRAALILLSEVISAKKKAVLLAPP